MGEIECAKELLRHRSKIYLGYRRVLWCCASPSLVLYKVIFEVIEAQRAALIVSVFHHSKGLDLWKERI